MRLHPWMAYRLHFLKREAQLSGSQITSRLINSYRASTGESLAVGEIPARTHFKKMRRKQ